MCFVVVLGAFAPRLAIFLLWVFSNRLDRVVDSFWVGLAGFAFLPFTYFLYALCHAPGKGVTGFGWFVVTLGFLLDLSNWFGSGREGRQVARR